PAHPRRDLRGPRRRACGGEGTAHHRGRDGRQAFHRGPGAPRPRARGRADAGRPRGAGARQRGAGRGAADDARCHPGGEGAGAAAGGPEGGRRAPGERAGSLAAAGYGGAMLLPERTSWEPFRGKRRTDMVARFRNISVDREGPIAFVTMERPERRNALSLELLTALLESLRAIGADRELRVAA